MIATQAIKTIYLVLILLLNTSCNNKNASKENVFDQNKKTILQDLPKKDVMSKLKYTSGIRSILHDTEGNYWFGSHNEGVCMFDGKNYTYFTTENGLSNNQVRRIQEDSKGIIWFGTANGICNYNGKEILLIKPQNTFIGIDIQKKENWKLKEDDLWFNAGNELGVYRYDGTLLTYLAFPIDENEDTTKDYLFTGFSKGINHNIWISTYDAAFGYNGKSFEVIDQESLGNLEKSGRLHIRSILEDSKGRLWIGNNGIGVLLKENGQLINFSEAQNLVHVASGKNGDHSPPGTMEHVFEITEDSNGNIWFGDRDTGVWKYDGYKMTNFTVDPALTSQHLWDIYEDRNGALLFAMGNGGVYMFNGNSFEQRF